MNEFAPLSIVLSAFALASLGACGPASRAMEDEHAEHELEPTSVTVFGERALLFLEHPHLVRGEPARFLAHLSVLASGEPVRSGRVRLELGSFALSSEGPLRDGLFVPEGAPSEAGRFAGRLVLESDELSETLELGELVVHASFDEARRAADAEAAGANAREIPFLMEQQWQVKLLVAEAAPRMLVARLAVPARARLAEGAEAVVAAPVAGLLTPPPGGSLPLTGARVESGALLGQVSAPLDAAALGALRALDLELDLRTLEVVRAAGAAEVRLRAAGRERERIAGLRAEDLSTQQALDQAESELAAARVESEAAARSKTALDELALRRASADRGRASADDGSYARPLSLPLLAPIAGTVVAAGRVAGEAVELGDELLRIVDGERLWIEGRVSEFGLAHLAAAPAAMLRFSGLGEERFELTSADFLHFGSEIEPESRTLLVRYSWARPDPRVRSGMLAELELESGRVAAAVAIPAAALVHDQGRATAYVMVNGEAFERRELELGLQDGDWIEVRRGLAPGEHVATRGAYPIKLASLSPAAFGAGHAH